MTIKSQGGIFGRNPTFNDVEVDGTLTVGGNTVPDASTILVDGDIGSTVQGYDADTAKLDVVQTWTATQNFATTTATATGYGTTDPSSPVDIFTATAGNANYEAIEMTNYDYGAGETGQSISVISKVRNDGGGISPIAALYFVKESDYSSAANRDGALAIYTNRSNSFVEAARFTSEGNLKFATSGNGIDFSATAGTGTSELFSDYEEGNWSPVLTATGSAPTVTHGLQRGDYTKVGNKVTANIYYSWSAFSGGSGDAIISGLPFSISTASGSYGSSAIAYFDGFTLASGRTQFGLMPLEGGTTARLQQFGSGSVSTTIDVTGVSSSGSIVATIIYFTS